MPRGSRWLRPLEKPVVRPSLMLRLQWTTDVGRTSCFGMVPRLSASNSCVRWLER